MNPQILLKYLDRFGNLHSNRGQAPHKPVLLLSILDEIDQGRISDNQVVLTEFLVAGFLEKWGGLPLPPGNWRPKVWIPFRYLTGNKFWKLVKNGVELNSDQVPEPNSIRSMKGLADHAAFVPELWELLQSKTTRDVLRQHLLQIHFGIMPGQVQPIILADPLQAQLEKLVKEAQSKPRPKKIRETADDTLYYVRHALFPKIIRTVYEDTCSVCGLFARTSKTSIVESAHIRPFADFHDDHPSNGLALCRDHHWGFDAGGFSIEDNYTVIVSPYFQHTPGYVNSGKPIRLPSSVYCYPDPVSLAHHRENTFLK